GDGAGAGGDPAGRAGRGGEGRQPARPAARARAGAGRDQRGMSGQTAAAGAAAIVSVACTCVVAARLLGRPRRAAPLIAWAIGFALFSIATICLWEGAWRGWSEDGFRLYYLSGGILVVAYLAVGEL